MKTLLISLFLATCAFAGFSGPGPLLPPVPQPHAVSASSVAMGSSSSNLFVLSSSSEAPLEAPSPPEVPIVKKACPQTSPSRQSADSLFARGDWSQAITAYDDVCPCLPKAGQMSCRLQAIRALGESATTAPEALRRLDRITISAEPENPGFGELMLTQTALYLRLKQPESALKSWKLAKQSALTGQNENLKALCTQIRGMWKDSSLSSDCGKMAPLAKPLAQTLLVPLTSSMAIQSSSSAVQTLAGETSWTLQFGAFSNKDNANLLLQNLKSRKIPSRIVTRNTADKVLWLIQTEPFPSKTSALEYGQKILVPLGLEYQALPSQ